MTVFHFAFVHEHHDPVNVPVPVPPSPLSVYSRECHSQDPWCGTELGAGKKAWNSLVFCFVVNCCNFECAWLFLDSLTTCLSKLYLCEFNYYHLFFCLSCMFSTNLTHSDVRKSKLKTFGSRENYSAKWACRMCIFPVILWAAQRSLEHCVAPPPVVPHV